MAILNEVLLKNVILGIRVYANMNPARNLMMKIWKKYAKDLTKTSLISKNRKLKQLSIF